MKVNNGNKSEEIEDQTRNKSEEIEDQTRKKERKRE